MDKENFIIANKELFDSLSNRQNDEIENLSDHADILIRFKNTAIVLKTSIYTVIGVMIKQNIDKIFGYIKEPDIHTPYISNDIKDLMFNLMLLNAMITDGNKLLK